MYFYHNNALPMSTESSMYFYHNNALPMSTESQWKKKVMDLPSEKKNVSVFRDFEECAGLAVNNFFLFIRN